MINKARGEFGYKIGVKTYAFAITLKAGQMLEDMSDTENAKDIETILSILSEMTNGTSTPLSIKQIGMLPITIVEFRAIVQGATEAANNAMPENRAVGNESSNRKSKRAKASKKKK